MICKCVCVDTSRNTSMVCHLDDIIVLFGMINIGFEKVIYLYKL